MIHHSGQEHQLADPRYSIMLLISQFENFNSIIVNQRSNLDQFAYNSKINLSFQEIIHEYLSIHWTIAILELRSSEVEGTKHWDAKWTIFSFLSHLGDCERLFIPVYFSIGNSFQLKVTSFLDLMSTSEIYQASDCRGMSSGIYRTP
jgi:hypothetical protein